VANRFTYITACVLIDNTADKRLSIFSNKHRKVVGDGLYYNTIYIVDLNNPSLKTFKNGLNKKHAYH
jgi:hypothetical protein